MRNLPVGGQVQHSKILTGVTKADNIKIFHRVYAFFLFALLHLSFCAYTQHINSNDLHTIRSLEDSMRPFAHDMIMAPQAEDRFAADSVFTKYFVKALRTPYSFNYKFDSIVTISKVYPPDSSFRIFTWQFERDESYFRQRGAIQMKTEDGSLKLFPLIDVSPFTSVPTDSVRGNLNWIGALYYGIVQKQYHNKNYYTLFGYDDNDFSSTRKWVDVLTFDAEGKPQFGGQYFSYPEDSIKPAQPAFRFCLEYKKDAHARINYDPEMDMIIFDHLISENNHLTEKYSLIPDGDYEGFKWNNGKWNYVEKVFDFKLKDGEAPVPNPVQDEDDNSGAQQPLRQGGSKSKKQ